MSKYKERFRIIFCQLSSYTLQFKFEWVFQNISVIELKIYFIQLVLNNVINKLFQYMDSAKISIQRYMTSYINWSTLQALC
jgi:hypothetical protein